MEDFNLDFYGAKFLLKSKGGRTAVMYLVEFLSNHLCQKKTQLSNQPATVGHYKPYDRPYDILPYRNWEDVMTGPYNTSWNLIPNFLSLEVSLPIAGVHLGHTQKSQTIYSSTQLASQFFEGQVLFIEKKVTFQKLLSGQTIPGASCPNGQSTAHWQFASQTRPLYFLPSRSVGKEEHSPHQLLSWKNPSSHSHYQVKNGCISNTSYLSTTTMFHFHDYGRNSCI